MRLHFLPCETERMTDRSSAVARWYIGRTLRRLREGQSLSAQDAASHIGKSRDTVERMESARTLPSRADVMVLLDHYDAPTTIRAQVLSRLEEARNPGWWTAYGVEDRLAILYGIEQDADDIHGFYHWCIPGFLQTEKYARELFKKTIPDEPDEDREIAVRMRPERYTHVFGGGTSVHLIIDESALRRNVGGPAVMRDQITQILNAPLYTLQVVPAEATHPGTASWMVAGVPGLGSVGYLEGFRAKEHVIETATEINDLTSAYRLIEAEAMSPTETRRWLGALLAELTSGP